MPIQNDTAVIIPAISAVPEKTFPHLWLSEINIQSSSIAEGTLNIQSLPYDGDTMEVAQNGPAASIYTEELWTAVQEVSSVAIAMQAIFDAVGPLKEWIANRQG